MEKKITTGRVRASGCSVTKYYITAEGEKDGRGDLWAESKVNNYNMVTHFFGAKLKKDHLSHLICNFPLSPENEIACCCLQLGWSAEVTGSEYRVGGGGSAGELSQQSSSRIILFKLNKCLFVKNMQQQIQDTSQFLSLLFFF